MRIVHVVTRWLRAGSEENTLLSCLHQLSQGHEVHLLYGDEVDDQYLQSLPSELIARKVPELIHPVRPLADLAALAALRSLYRELRPDIVHTHQSKAGVVGRMAAIGLKEIAVVHTVHIAPFLHHKWPSADIFAGIERICAAFTDAIINVSEGMKDACLAHKVGRPNQHHVVHSGMDLTRFRNAVAPSNWNGRIGGWHEDRRPQILLMLAAFEPRKQHEALITALAPALRARPDLCLLLAGAGSRLPAAQALATGLDVAAQVKFLGHDSRPEELIALADACMLVSNREGLPRVVVQYLSAGKPVIVCDLPGLDELVQHEGNGIVTPTDDVASASMAAIALLSDSPRLQALTRGARDTDTSRWGSERMGPAIEQIYYAALAHKRRAEGRNSPQPA